MKYLTALAAAGFLLSAIPSAQALQMLEASASNWPSCLGQQCCDMISELPISERSAFRAQHAYCERDERKNDRDEVVSLI
jgi:hypothetical protein